MNSRRFRPAIAGHRTSMIHLAAMAFACAAFLAGPVGAADTQDRPPPSRRPERTPPKAQPTTAPSDARDGDDVDDAPMRDASPPRDVVDDPLRALTGRITVADGVVSVRDVTYATVVVGDARVDMAMDLAFPAESTGPLPAVVYIHGGGWRGGARQSGAPFVRAFAKGGYFAATISYRLSDIATYPAAVHDVKGAIRFLRANADRLGIDPQRIGVWGHSAGGHLAALLATSGNSDRLEGAVGGDVGGTAVRCAVCVSGPTDLLRPAGSAGGRGLVEQWLGTEDEALYRVRAKEASPVTYVDAADPPILIVHGTRDTLVPLAQAETFARALEAAGVQHDLLVVEGAGHGIRSPEAYVRIAQFFDAQLGGDLGGAIGMLIGRTGRRPE